MSLYSDLKAFVKTKAYTNGNNEITGQMVQDALVSMITSLGAGYQYMGVATTSTNPGTPDQKVFYLASAVGTYSNFGGLTVADGEFVVLYYDSSWHKAVTGAATKAAVDQLGQNLLDLVLVGKGTTLVYNDCYVVVPGHIYRIYTKSQAWNTDSIADGTNIFAVSSYNSWNTETNLFKVYKGTDVIKPYYDFQLPADCDRIRVMGRASDGTAIYYVIKDVTYIDEILPAVAFGTPAKLTWFDFGLTSEELIAYGSRNITSTLVPVDYSLILRVNNGGRFLVGYTNGAGQKIGETGWISGVDKYDISKDVVANGATHYYVMVDILEAVTAEIRCIAPNKEIPQSSDNGIRVIDERAFFFVPGTATNRLRQIYNYYGTASVNVYAIPQGFTYDVQVSSKLGPTGSSQELHRVFNSGFLTEPFSAQLEYPDGKYVLFLFKKTDDSDFSTADILAIKNGFKFDINVFESEGKPLNLMWQTGRVNNTTGSLEYTANRRVSQYIKRSNCTRIFVPKSVNNGRRFVIFTFDANLRFVEDTGWHDVDTFDPSQISGEYFRLMIDSSVLEDSDILLFAKEDYAHAFNMKNAIVGNNNAKFAALLNDAVILSDPATELMAHASSLVVSSTGRVYLAYYCNETTTQESATLTTTYPKLVIANIAGFGGREEFVPIRANETIVNSDESTFTQGDYPPYDPYLLLDEAHNTLYYYFTHNYNKFAVRLFNTTTKQWGDVFDCKLRWTIGGVQTEVDFDCAGMKQCAIAFGRNPGDFSRAIMSGCRFIQIGNEYFFCVGTMATIPAFIVKTSDFLTFDVVTITPELDSDGNNVYCSEPGIEFFDNNTILFISRRYDAVGLVCGRYKIDTGTWDFVKKFDVSSITCKPAITKVNGKIYVNYNVEVDIHNDFGTAFRSRMNFGEIDQDFNFDLISVLLRDDAIHYPSVFPFKGSLYMTYSEDRRKMSAYLRSDIAIVKLLL